MAAYALTVFLSSFLLFQVQPLIGKYILPWFGGSPAVWTTCMLFFQVALLAGYGYAHLASRVGVLRQGYLHAGLLAAALLFLPIAPSADYWKTSAGEMPALRILLLLLTNIGVPYLLLSATAPLVQHWFVRSFPGRSPYRLYALSNTGSLLALVSYPFLIEPNLTLNRQVTAWGWGFAVFVLCCGWCAFRMVRSPDTAVYTASREDSSSVPQRLAASDVTLWLFLSACGSALLLATTNQLCQEVAVVPFLWVAPLALYLVTFIICFNSERAADRLLWGLLLFGAVIFSCRVFYQGVYVNLPVQILVYLAALFTCCMVCHGELARSRPDPRLLTAYYLIIATGGAVGGIFVALAAPYLFHGFWEFPITLSVSCLVILIAWFRGGAFSGAPRWLPAILVGGQLLLIVFTGNYLKNYHSLAMYSARNFYGVLRVIRESDANGERLSLMHGGVVHGTQFTSPAKRGLPTTYYGPGSAAGLALQFHPRRFAADPRQRDLRVGVIGLGTGTLASYGKPGDVFRFYEINPEVIRLSEKYFSYRRESAARIDIATGDARIVMENDLKMNTAQHFDVLIVDAFSSDAIPVHLLTRECFSVYWRHMKPDGLLLLHITNRFLDLEPVVRAQAAALGCRAELVRSPADPVNSIGKADWMILTNNEHFLHSDEIEKSLEPSPAPGTAPLLWTDDFASLWKVLKR
jgi:hypothetical protein